MINKYKHITNKKINVQLNGAVVYSYKITKMQSTEEFLVGLEGSGRIYNCAIEYYDKKMEDAIPNMAFDEKTLDGLAEHGFSECPTVANLYFVLDGKKVIKPQDN